MIKFLLLFLLSFSFSQTVSDYAYTHAKVAAMAGAVVAETGSNWSIFHNPAGITEIEGTYLSAGSGNLFGFKWLPTYNLGGTAPLPVIGKKLIDTPFFKFKLNPDRGLGGFMFFYKILSIESGFTDIWITDHNFTGFSAFSDAIMGEI